MTKMDRSEDAENDPALSCKAKFIHSQLKKRKKTGDFYVSNLVELSKDNRYAILTGISELKRAKYLYYFRLRKRNVFYDFYVVFNKRTDFKYDLQKWFSAQKPTKKYVGNCIHYNYVLDTLYQNISMDIPIPSYLSKEDGPPLAESRELGKLVDFWQDNFKRHRTDSKTFAKGKARLEKRYALLNKNKLIIKTRKKRPSDGYKIIRGSLETYSELLKTGVIPHRWPHYVGLDEFFGFSVYSKKNLFKNLKGAAVDIVKIGSWFSECRAGLNFCIERHGADQNPVITKALANYCGLKKLDDELLIRAAKVYVEYFESCKGRLNLPRKIDMRYPARFMKYLFKFIDKEFKSRRFRPYVLLGGTFLEVDFNGYLIEMGWLKK